MTTFHLIRHATNDYLGHAIAGRQPGVHLNDEGRRQASYMSDSLASASIHKILSSPLERCLETAAPLARCLGLEVEISDAFTELDFGEWTNKTEKWLGTNSAWHAWNSFRSGARMPNGEMMIEVQSRAVAEIHRLSRDFPGQTLALVTHGDVIRAVLAYFLGMPLDFILRLEISPASVSTLEFGEAGTRALTINQRPWANR